MNKHTPGPWVIARMRFGRDVEVTTQDRIGRSIGPICEMDTDFTGSIGPEQEANATLIAAAPELLEALKHMVEAYAFDYGEDCPATMQARAAIAKAEGGLA